MWVCVSQRNVRSVVTSVLDLGVERANRSRPVSMASQFRDRVRVYGEYQVPLEGRVLIVPELVPPHLPLWRCYACGVGGAGERAILDLAVAAHLTECVGTVDTANIRFALLRALIEECEEAYSTASGWNGTVIRMLLLDGGVWTLLAEKTGWPVGLYGVEGWDTDLDSALTRYGVTRSEIFRR